MACLVILVYLKAITSTIQINEYSSADLSQVYCPICFEQSKGRLFESLFHGNR